MAERDEREEFVEDYEQDQPEVESQRWRRYFIDGAQMETSMTGRFHLVPEMPALVVGDARS